MLRQIMKFAFIFVTLCVACGHQSDTPKQESLGSARQALSCTSYPEWTITTYTGGDRVKHGGNAYECKPFPYSGWCGQAGYEPGVTLYWQDAWIPLGACDSSADASIDGDAADATGSGGSGGSGGGTSTCPAPVPPPLPDPTCVDGNCCPSGSQVVTLTNNSDNYSNTTTGVCVVALSGSDTISSAAPAVTVVGGNDNDTVSAGQFPPPGAGTEPVRVYGGPGNDTIHGWFDHAEIFGGPGDDTIAAGPGVVFVAPGSGADTVASGDADDTFVLYAECEATPQKNLDAQGGYDTLISPLSIDQLRARNITVNGFENVIIRGDVCKSDCVPKPACGALQKCIDQGGQAVCKGDKGATCQSCGDCVAGLVCSSSTCQDPCVVDPRAPGCAPAHCSNGVKDGNETDVDCGGDCPPCNTGGGCNANTDCGSGLVCGENNGGCFGVARAKHVCWPSTCEAGGNKSACGQTTSACGQNCACVTVCDSKDPNTVCPSGEVCKAKLGPLLESPFADVCIDPRCPSDDPALCGGPNSLCGMACVCKPNCTSASSTSPGDGCGGLCPGICKAGEAGCCIDDVNCPAGFACLMTTDGKKTCRPGDCAYRILAPPLCGISGALCGDECPACTPRCDGRHCGPDPNCGQSCGTCGAGTYCNGSGECAVPTIPTPITVTDGKGGKRPIVNLTQPAPSDVGALKGMFSVSEQGTSAFTVPIDVPPGRAGMQPALALNYSGSRVNDDVGVGWHLDGLSKITRCPRSHALDGYSHPIKNDTTDHFCIDGKRLEAVAGVSGGATGVYGANGTEYRTLIDSFARVVSHIDDGSGIQLDPTQTIDQVTRSKQGPDSFRVWTKDGRILTFGGTRDSLVMGRNGLRYTWLLRRVEDRAGNTMTVNYTNIAALLAGIFSSSVPTVVRPSLISYTGHGSDLGNRHVRFSYETRTDRQLKFMQGGVPLMADARLSRITTFVSDVPVKNYHLVYGDGPVSQITKIFECTRGDDTHCKPPTQFEYQTESGYTFGLGPDIEDAGQLDANGDGFPDYLTMKAIVHSVDANPWLAAAEIVADVAIGVGAGFLSSGAGFAVTVMWNGGKGGFWGLFEKDPEVEVVGTMYLGTGKRQDPIKFVGNVGGIPCMGRSPKWFLDYDRDGKDDIVVGCSDNFDRRLYVARSLGNGQFESFPSDGSAVASVRLRDYSQCRNGNQNSCGSLPPSLPGPVFLDVDGDSLQDLIYCKDVSTLGLRLRLGPTEGFADTPIEIAARAFCNGPPPPPCCTHPSTFGSRPSYNIFDADGDGTSDLVVRAPDGWQILRYSISAGAPILQFQPIGLPDVGDSTLGAGLSLGDFNGDGLLDLYRSSGDQAVIWLNGADGRFSSRHLHRPQPALDLNDRFGPFSFQRTGFVDQDGRTVPVEAWQTPEVDVGNGAFSIHFFDVALPPDSLITNLGTTDPKILWPQGGLVDPDKLVPGSFRKAADLDGDGNLDLFGYNAGAFYGSGLRNRLLNRVVDGLGNVIKINYDENNTSDDPEQRTYHTDAECAGTAWPEMCLKQMSGLVSSHKEGFVAADGRDMVERSSEYHYVNARMNLTGEGWLGFDRRVIRSLASDSPSQAPTGSLHERIVTTEYEPIARYDAKGQRIDSTKAVTPPYLYPLAGLPRTITIDDYPGKSGLISTDPPGHPSIENGSYNRRTRIENEWQVRLSAFARPFPVAFRRTTKTFDRPIPAAPLPFEDNGTLLSLCQDDSAVDDYGNVVRSMERCQPEGQGFGEVHLTDTFIVPDPVNWLISNPTTIHNVSSRNGDEAAPVWGFTYTNGLLESVTRVVGDTAKQHKTTYTRDDFGNVTQILEEVASGEPSRTTAITYEIDNVFPSTITNAKGQTTQVSFDTRWGTPITIADPNDIVVQHGYDDFGRLVETRAPDGNTTTTYSNAFVAPVGHVQHIQVSVERQGTEGTRTANVVSEYDHHGQLVKTGSAGFGGVPITQEQTHDTLGRLTSSTLPHTADASVVPVDRYSYDRLLRLKRVDHSDKTFREYQYASSATLGSQYTQWLGGLTCGGVPIPLCAVNFVRTFDEQERENVVITDHRGLVVRSVDGENVENMVHSSNYTFGAFGRLIDARDNENNLTHFDYDEFGRRLGVTDPDTGLTASTYNGYDELRTTRDPKRQTRTYHYDELGRIVRIDDPAGATQWVYDQGTNALGRLSETISPATPENPSGNHVAYTYESPTPTANRGLIQRIDTTLDGTDYPIAFDYDDLSRTDRIHYPSLGSAAPIVAKYHYDTSGILTGVDEVGSNATRPLWQLQEAFQAHLIRRESFGNGASTVYDYHPHRRWLDSIQTTHGSNAVQSLEYSHWNNGLVRARTIPTESREHTYDGLNRLSSTIDTFPDGSTRSTPYTYDALGNITGRGATLINYRTDQPHLVDFVGQNSDTYGYDLNGNVNERSGPDVPGGLQTFQYMPFDLPSAIHTGTGASAKTTQFEYTADETRAVRRDTDTTRYFVGELYERVVTTAPTATLEERFRLYAGGRQLGEIVRNASGDRTLFFHTDRLGSVDTITDERPPSFQQAFDPFGMPIDPPTPAITRAGFTGHAHDDDLGLIDMRGRIYDPLAARFTSADPVMQAPFWSQGLNRYSYVFNDPVNHVDPSGFVIEGLGTWEFCGECASAVGAGSGIGGALLGAAFNAGESFLAGGLGGAKPGGTFNVPAPSAAPTSAPTGQGSMHATAQNRGGVGPSSPPPPAKGGNPAIGGGPASLPLSGGNASANPGICVLVPEICVGEALLSIFDLFTASTGRKLLDFIKDKVTPRDNEPRVDLYHGSAGPGTGRLDPHRLPVNVTRDLRAAQNALEYHPDRVPGAGFIIHSSVPKSLFDRWFLPFERPYPGFYPYIPGGSTEVPLNTTAGDLPS